MKINAIDHVTLYVHSIDRVKEFYCEVLGLMATKVEDNEGKYLTLENEYLHFFVIEDAVVSPEFISKQHLSFAVDQLDDVIERLNHQKIAYQVGTYNGFKYQNFRWCEWLDPEGIRLECVQHL